MSDKWEIGQHVAMMTGTVGPHRRIVLKLTKLHVLVGKSGDDPQTARRFNRLTGREVGRSRDIWNTTSITPWTAEHAKKLREQMLGRELYTLIDRLTLYSRNRRPEEVNPAIVEHLRNAVAMLPKENVT